ncbi:PREDICTED: protein FAM179B-like, partial [Atta cephalotes]|uniref:CLASP N-terminal domain-containing protein n=1 Tax=Atta cephalotes TaxID=12957 RepID=A0A158NWM6_ATTCE
MSNRVEECPRKYQCVVLVGVECLPTKELWRSPSEKSKRMIQQCFLQLENKDWEITMKGLKALSQISKQHPEDLDICAARMIGRLLGRHIKNLRSQVARAACLAAGDVFSSQVRGIDQDLDDIAGSLLHRTADTNRFLQSDSNSALDQMVQYLPPHKTIGIIVLGGA